MLSSYSPKGIYTAMQKRLYFSSNPTGMMISMLRTTLSNTTETIWDRVRKNWLKKFQPLLSIYHDSTISHVLHYIFMQLSHCLLKLHERSSSILHHSQFMREIYIFCPYKIHIHNCWLFSPWNYTKQFVWGDFLMMKRRVPIDIFHELTIWQFSDNTHNKRNNTTDSVMSRTSLQPSYYLQRQQECVAVLRSSIDLDM